MLLLLKESSRKASISTGWIKKATIITTVAAFSITAIINGLLL